MKFTVIAFATLLVIACTSLPEDPQGSTLRLRFGESARVPGTTTEIAFSDVTADSRCPTTVVCVWAGDAAVVLQSGAESVTLHTNTSAGPASAQLQGWTVTLVEVEPQRTTTEPPRKTDYGVALRFTR